MLSYHFSCMTSFHGYSDWNSEPNQAQIWKSVIILFQIQRQHSPTGSEISICDPSSLGGERQRLTRRLLASKHSPTHGDQAIAGDSASRGLLNNNMLHPAHMNIHNLGEMPPHAHKGATAGLNPPLRSKVSQMRTVWIDQEGNSLLHRILGQSRVCKGCVFANNQLPFSLADLYLTEISILFLVVFCYF